MKEILTDRVVSIETTIKNDKLYLMKALKDSKSESSEAKDLKNFATISSQLYVVNQVYENTLKFYSDENVKHPPSISEDGELHHGSNSDLIQELIDTSKNSVVVDLAFNSFC